MLTGGKADICIGANVDIGPRVLLVTGGHHLWENKSLKAAGSGFSKNIEVQHGVWIGANSTILGGSSIGERTAVGACSLVTGALPNDVLVVGIPARIVKENT